MRRATKLEGDDFRRACGLGVDRGEQRDHWPQGRSASIIGRVGEDGLFVMDRSILPGEVWIGNQACGNAARFLGIERAVGVPRKQQLELEFRGKGVGKSSRKIGSSHRNVRIFRGEPSAKDAGKRPVPVCRGA
jgi:hypothetical protein